MDKTRQFDQCVVGLALTCRETLTKITYLSKWQDVIECLANSFKVHFQTAKVKRTLLFCWFQQYWTSISAVRVWVRDRVQCLVFRGSTEYDFGWGARGFERILTNSIQSEQLSACRADGWIAAWNQYTDEWQNDILVFPEQIFNGMRDILQMGSTPANHRVIQGEQCRGQWWRNGAEGQIITTQTKKVIRS